MFAINNFIHKTRLSKETKNKIKSYIEYLLEEESTKKQEQDYFLSIIPIHMKKEVLIDINSKILLQNLIFNINFSKTFLLALSYKMQERTLGPEEIIFLVTQTKISIILLGIRK